MSEYWCEIHDQPMPCRMCNCMSCGAPLGESVPVLETPPDRENRAEIQRMMDELDELMEETELSDHGQWVVHCATRNGLQRAMNVLDGLVWDAEEEDWVSRAPVEPVPAPRLEWRDRSLETPGHAEWVSGRWRIYDNGHRVMLCLSERPGYDDAEIVVVDDTTVPAAKSLAEKLNDVLSPPVGTQE